MADQRTEMMQMRRDVGRSLIDLEPSAILELYELYFDVDQEPFRFHAGTNNLSRDIIWNGNPYYASAIEVEGFEANIMGRLPRPKVSVSNTDGIISSILRDYSDFRNGKFVRVKLFLKHLDAINFDDSTNPFGTPLDNTYISKEKYIVSQKLMENKRVIQFELITPFDLQSLDTASRAIYGRYCYWQYRGLGCNYQGDLICQDNDKDFTVSPDSHLRNSDGSFTGGTFAETILPFKWVEDKDYAAGNVVYVSNIDINGLKDPPRTWFVCKLAHTSSRFITPNNSVDYWEKDGCSKLVGACKKRYKKTSGLPVYVNANGESFVNDASTVGEVLPFGGFPGTDRFPYER
jgi:lambda family phage minor tail protein L